MFCGEVADPVGAVGGGPSRVGRVAQRVGLGGGFEGDVEARLGVAVAAESC